MEAYPFGLSPTGSACLCEGIGLDMQSITFSAFDGASVLIRSTPQGGVTFCIENTGDTSNVQSESLCLLHKLILNSEHCHLQI
jgi:hypothetical protein